MTYKGIIRFLTYKIIPVILLFYSQLNFFLGNPSGRNGKFLWNFDYFCVGL